MTQRIDMSLNFIQVSTNTRTMVARAVEVPVSKPNKRYKSPLWDHFVKDPNDLKWATCLHCNEKVMLKGKAKMFKFNLVFVFLRFPEATPPPRANLLGQCSGILRGDILMSS